MACTNTNWLLPSFTGFYRVLLAFAGFNEPVPCHRWFGRIRWGRSRRRSRACRATTCSRRAPACRSPRSCRPPSPSMQKKQTNKQRANQLQSAIERNLSAKFQIWSAHETTKTRSVPPVPKKKKKQKKKEKLKTSIESQCLEPRGCCVKLGRNYFEVTSSSNRSSGRCGLFWHRPRSKNKKAKLGWVRVE